MWCEGSFTSASALEEKKIQMLALGLRLYNHFEAEQAVVKRDTPLHVPLNSISFHGAMLPAWELIQLKPHPGKLSYAFCGNSDLGWLKMMETANLDCSLKTIPILQA